ncbi:MAG TPA: GlsB/YeaQ/YmgE family stress response membrane protein [Planctomycetaceae bacterium]|nr:GlsB/YeaQ/YmgE family stress response membrane protein [Planctomycetaceae bacterium]
MPNLTLSQLIVWIIVGALAGNLVGRFVTLKREGLGRWTNLAVGMGGALIGGTFFSVTGLLAGLRDIRITLEDLVSALIGALFLIAVWWLVRWYRGRKKPL